MATAAKKPQSPRQSHTFTEVIVDSPTSAFYLGWKSDGGGWAVCQELRLGVGVLQVQQGTRLKGLKTMSPGILGEQDL